MAKTIPFFIGGHEVAGKGRTAPVFNPATGEQTASVSLASTAEVNEAVDSLKLFSNIHSECVKEQVADTRNC